MAEGNDNEMGRVTVRRLIGLASQVCALTVDEILGRKRQRRFIRARMAIVHYAIEAGYGCADTGRRLGGRDHSTICNLRDKASIWRGRDPLFDRIMDAMAQGVAEGKASRPVMPFLLPAVKLAEVSELDDVDLADVRMRYAMQRASTAFLNALKEAA